MKIEHMHAISQFSDWFGCADTFSNTLITWSPENQPHAVALYLDENAVQINEEIDASDYYRVIGFCAMNEINMR